MSNSDSFTGRGFDPVPLYKALLLTIVAVFVATPLVATVLGGFKSLGELRTNPFGLPQVWEWQNYAGILLSKRYWQLLGNSLIISTMTVVLTLIAASMAAFVFAQIKFFGSAMLMSYLTMGLLFPAATAILPLFIKVRDLGLLDSYFGVVLPQAAFALAMSILLLRFVNSWNSYLIPLIMLNSDDLYPWPLGIMVYQGEYSSEWHLILAFVTLTILPTIVVFLFAQKHIVAGLTAGAVKG